MVKALLPWFRILNFKKSTMYTIDQLKELAKPYLEDVPDILVTDDGQFFYNNPEGETYARNYAFRAKVKVWLVSQEEIAEKKVLDKVGVNTVVSSDVDKEAAKKLAKEEKAKKQAELKNKQEEEAERLALLEKERLAKEEKAKEQVNKPVGPDVKK
jgi:hypothetical protein